MSESSFSLSSLSSELQSIECIPRDSLLSLNEHCLWDVLKFLDLENLCQMANVSKQFRSIAELVFHQYYRNEIFKNQDLSRHVLCKFGHLIKYINECFEFNVEGITKYCQPNLEHLTLYWISIDCNLMEPIFGRLKCLNISECDFIGDAKKLFQNCLQLEKLRFNPRSYRKWDNLLVQKFPKLKEFSQNDRMRCETLHEFLLLNSQLEKLDIGILSEDESIAAIVKHAPNLVALNLFLWSPNSESIKPTKEGILELAKLSKLKTLELVSHKGFHNEFGGPLIKSLANAKMPIEELSLYGFSTSFETGININDLCTFKMMNTLRLEGKLLLENELISIATELPLLSKLQVNGNVSITADCLIKLVKIGQRLEDIYLIRVENLHIDQHVFEALVNAVQGENSKRSLFIQAIALSGSRFDVPKSLRESASKHLLIAFNIRP